MRIRTIIYLALGLVLVVVGGMTEAIFDWRIEFVWLIIAALAFSSSHQLAGVAGLLFGLTLDWLSGGGTLIYTLGYGGLGVILSIARKLFMLDGLIAGWISSFIGAEILWLFIALFARALLMLGIPISPPGWISPYLISVAVGYPFFHYVTSLVYPDTDDSGRKSRYLVSIRSGI